MLVVLLFIPKGGRGREGAQTYFQLLENGGKIIKMKSSATLISSLPDSWTSKATVNSDW